MIKKMFFVNLEMAVLNGALFLNDIENVKRCVHNKDNPGDSCFINCCSFKKFNGLFWYHPTRGSLHDLKVGAFEMTNIDD